MQHVLLLKRQCGFDIFWMILVIHKRNLQLSTMTIKLQFNLWSILNLKNALNIFIFNIIHYVNFTNIRTLVYVCTQNQVFVILTNYLSTNKFHYFHNMFNLQLVRLGINLSFMNKMHQMMCQQSLPQGIKEKIIIHYTLGKG